MSVSQSSPTGAAPPTADTSLLHIPDMSPKPPSHFRLATPAMYNIYLAFWHERIERFNIRTARHRSNYELILTQDEEGFHQRLLVPLAEEISHARESLMADLTKLEQDFEVWCNGTGSGGLGDYRN